MLCSRTLPPVEIRMAGCFEVSRRNSAFQFVRHPSPCARLQVALTTILTTERLDVLGRPWTMLRQKLGIQAGVGQL